MCVDYYDFQRTKFNKKMKKVIIILAIILGLAGFIFAVSYIIKSNSKEKQTFKTEKPSYQPIGKTIVATGKIVPVEEIEIKPNISGIIDKLLVVEGQKIEQGQLIATIRVVPQVNDLNNAQQQLKSSQITLMNEQRNFNRQKLLFTQGVISRAEYEVAETSYKMAQQNVQQAQKQIQIIKTGVAPGLESVATTQIRATTSGIVLNVPIKKGTQVIEANSFNPGTTVCTIADVNKMIFEGKVDEAEAGKLKEGMPIKISIGALPDSKLNGNLFFIAPKGSEENGAVQFEIKANVLIPMSGDFVRAGYSANATIELDKERKVLTISEALVQYDNEKPFVEIKQKNGSFTRKDVELGASNGILVEVKKGLTKNDEVKIWNETEEQKDKK